MKFIAEIGLNHEGNFDLAYEMIRQAKFSGADIVKFQFGWRDKPGEINYISEDQAQQLKKWCEYLDIEILVSPISLKGYEILKKLNLKNCKIASRTVIDNPEMCKDIIKNYETVYCSLGFWNKKKLPFEGVNVKYLYCVSKYPTYPYDLVNFPKEFKSDKYSGYSDHTHGIAACLMAISRGAKIIEKHFTLNKASQSIRDHVMSSSPEEFKTLVILGKELAKLSEK